MFEADDSADLEQGRVKAAVRVHGEVHWSYSG